MLKKSIIISILKSQFMCVHYRGGFVSVTDIFPKSCCWLTWALGLSSIEPSVTNICPLHWKMSKRLSCTVSHLGPQNEMWFYITELIYGTCLFFSWKLLRNWTKKWNELDSWNFVCHLFLFHFQDSPKKKKKENDLLILVMFQMWILLFWHGAQRVFFFNFHI